MFTKMIECRLDVAQHTIMVRPAEEWLDARFVEHHRGLQNAASVLHNRAMEKMQGSLF